VRIYDADTGQFAVDEQMAIDELRNERPLLLGTVGHAMVLTAMRYVRSQWGDVQIIGATVRDPWPGTGRRELDWHEMDPAYVATIDIAKPPAPSPGEPAVRRHDEARARVCRQACQAEADTCESGIPKLQPCLEEAAAMCVESCVYDHGYSQWACEQRLCSPRSEANRGWQSFCEQQLDMARGGCRQTQTLCQELCL
jgi:hypothetical protein